MRTIAVIARKGGSGKTTVATHLAIAGHLRGVRTLLADTDPQRSAMEVLRARSGPGPERIDTAAPKLFNVQVGAQRDKVDALIIDTPAGPVDDLAHAIVLADLSILVLRPSFLDIAAAIHTVDVVRRLRKPALIVLNQAPAMRGGVEPPQVKKALKALSLMRLPVIPTIIRSRAAYQSALEIGRSAEEIVGDPAAAREMGALWDYVERFAFPKRQAEEDEAAAMPLFALGAQLA